MRFQVPQNLDVADTIFLGLSFKQILFIGGGLGVTFFLFIFAPLWVTILIGGPFILLGVLLAFYTHNSQPFIVIFQSAIKFAKGKKTYIWKKEGREKEIKISIDRKPQEKISASSKTADNKVKELGTQLIFESNVSESTGPDVNI